jgi:alpha-N-arabinofuranosidase
MQRRTFLKTAAGFAVSGSLFAADADIELTPAGTGSLISPHIYGHFIEHLGGVIYDGIWVGEDSRIPNAGGIRKAFVDDMKRIGAPNLRWPGGCFADGYHWRDGIGAAARRPRTYNYWQAQMPAGTDATEPNRFGTHEFMRLCRLVGAQPYLAANVGSSTPKEFYDWVGYANAPAGTLSLAGERAANGDQAPFGIKYWGVGNESWGCGGRMSPAEYAGEYRKFSAQVPAYGPMFLVACGPRGHSADFDIGWTTGFFEALRGVRVAPPDGFAMHYYTDFRPTPVKAEASDQRAWYSVLHKGAQIGEVIEKHWAAMGSFDPSHKTKLVIDEWGTWYSPESRRIAPRYILSQTMTLRDAVHAAMTFDIFNRHADKIEMANIAQTINCLHSLFMAEGARYVRTPVFDVFEMYRTHMGSRLAGIKIRAEALSVQLLEGNGKLDSLAGSASVKGNSMTLTLTNPSTDSSVKARVRTAGATIAEARATVLTHTDPQAANTFDAPDAVRPTALKAELSGGSVAINLPPQSVAAVQLRLS